MSAPTHRYPQSEIDAVYRAIRERRDMRHFNDQPVEPALLARLLEAAHAGPSVGFMQPWRFIRISDGQLRRAIHGLVEQERLLTAQALGEREDEFMKLKVEAVLECGELIVAALMDGRQDHVFGRRTLPAMDLASLACALQNMWLAARAEGLGMGWVSLFDPLALADLLGMPAGAQPVAVVCLGHVPEFYPEPMLQRQHWARRRDLQELVFDNRWPKETT
ncbi:5,6-dimethylbenzimidazole synthase [Herbaspirillum sp. YR522]|uniref:5,6-dimethylbenzimidazole synthase n=1 Tax=Herbaspirillum sp. YR522 TaxID=1144342 RepID=UPI00026F9104|nr:5,6-dimethylbenzimidazole synthase [Herbaspirillum sp. YR522]EJN06964.1 cob(II)yrinic acid a,c-diamide reductase [Herbaspirillum sp. YR522]